jgi:transmembrane sensor
MDASPELLPFWEELSPEAQAALRQLLKQEPELAQTLALWEAVQAHLHQAFEKAVPDRRLWVLYALARSGHQDALSPEEQALLEAARPTLEQLLAVYPALNEVVRDIEAACVDFEAAWESQLKKATPVRDRLPRVSRRWAGYLWGLRLAVGGVVLALVGVLWWQHRTAWVTQSVDTGKVQTLTLPDGSSVRLVGPAALHYAERFDRRVQLEGQALLQVQPAAVPFVVETAEAQITVRGTRFGVRALKDTTEVILAQGRLTVHSRKSPALPVELAPGQGVRVAADGQVSPPARASVPEMLQWTGLHVFDGATMAEIGRYLATFYRVPVIVDAALADEPVVGTFAQTQPLEEILSALAATLGAHLEQQEGSYRLVLAR